LIEPLKANASAQYLPLGALSTINEKAKFFMLNQ
jgi:hypothetical protein